MHKTKSYSEEAICRMLMNMLNRASSKPQNEGLISLVETSEEAGLQTSDTGFMLTMGNGQSFEIFVVKCVE